MPLSARMRAELEPTLPAADATRARMQDYMLRAALNPREFGERFSYSPSAVRAFLKNRYAEVGRSDLSFRKACEEYMDRHPLGAPVTATAGRLYETENVIDIRRWFEHCHRHRALACVYGPPGSQKTFVLQHLIAEFNLREMQARRTRNRAYLLRASVNIQPRDMLAKLCVATGAVASNTLQRCVASLAHHLRHTQTLVVIDEAQLCGIPTLEALRELHDVDPRVGILLAGSHELNRRFEAHAAELEQWNSRIDNSVELAGVSDACARSIVEAECPHFTPDQVATFVDQSRVQDAYSRQRGRMYLSMRRLFKNIGALRELEAEAQEATA